MTATATETKELQCPFCHAFVFSLLCFGVAYLLVPKPGKRPDKIVSREKFPTLYQFVDEVSDAV